MVFTWGGGYIGLCRGGGALSLDAATEDDPPPPPKPSPPFSPRMAGATANPKVHHFLLASTLPWVS